MKIAINGFGRIGRTFYRAANNSTADQRGMERGSTQMNVVAINDLGDVANLKYLLKYDTVYGIYDKECDAKFLAEKEPEKLPWSEMGVDVVLESTGFFTKKEGASKHLEAGAKKVIISAPSNDADVVLIPGINDNLYDPENHHIISMGSCTTNCIVPMVKVLDDNFKIVKGSFTTTHSYTSTQALVDRPEMEDWRRGRSGAENMVPTTTGAAKAIFQIFPQLRGKIDALSVRVPTPTVSLVDFVCEVEKDTTSEEVNQKFKDAVSSMGGALAVSDEPLVSSDLRANPNASILNADLTKVTDGNLVHIVSWYDNEMGYSHRLVKLVELISSKQ